MDVLLMAWFVALAFYVLVNFRSLAMVKVNNNNG